MPAESDQQLRMMRQVRSVQEGRSDNAPEKIRDVARSMKKQDVRDFTKRGRKVTRKNRR